MRTRSSVTSDVPVETGSLSSGCRVGPYDPSQAIANLLARVAEATPSGLSLAQPQQATRRSPTAWCWNSIRSKLKDATSAKCENDDSPQNHGGQQSNRKRKPPGRTTGLHSQLAEQALDLVVLQVLQDENEDYNQRGNSNDESSPGPPKVSIGVGSSPTRPVPSVDDGVNRPGNYKGRIVGRQDYGGGSTSSTSPVQSAVASCCRSERQAPLIRRSQLL